jgi:rSAM/selenodomain-associated transferase 1
MAPERLIIFVKAPRAGAVKTRLAEGVGAEAAAAAYRTLVATLVQSLTPISEVELRFAPDEAAGEIESWRRASWRLRPQGHGDLGQRLRSAFDDAFADGVERVVVIGSDCPRVTAGDITDAWAALRQDEVVLGPATDGGYWLIGLRSPQPTLFQNIHWSSAMVLRETQGQAHAANLSVHLLRTLSDVDTEKDWLEYLASR